MIDLVGVRLVSCDVCHQSCLYLVRARTLPLCMPQKRAAVTSLKVYDRPEGVQPLAQPTATHHAPR